MMIFFFLWHNIYLKVFLLENTFQDENLYALICWNTQNKQRQKWKQKKNTKKLT